MGGEADVEGSGQNGSSWALQKHLPLAAMGSKAAFCDRVLSTIPTGMFRTVVSKRRFVHLPICQLAYSPVCTMTIRAVGEFTYSPDRWRTVSPRCFFADPPIHRMAKTPMHSSAYLCRRGFACLRIQCFTDSPIRPCGVAPFRRCASLLTCRFTQLHKHRFTQSPIYRCAQSVKDAFTHARPQADLPVCQFGASPTRQ